MEKSKRLIKPIRAVCYLAVMVSLAGCFTTIPQIRTKSETEIAVAAIKSEWLKPCTAPVESEPSNTVGGLLQDYLETAEAFAICMKRHNDFVGYIKPVIVKELSSPK